LGVYLHGLAGDIAASEKGQHSIVSSDIIEAIPGAFRALLESHGSQSLEEEGPLKW
jgi:NAD(P)H-hydrate epimerase